MKRRDFLGFLALAPFAFVPASNGMCVVITRLVIDAANARAAEPPVFIAISNEHHEWQARFSKLVEAMRRWDAAVAAQERLKRTLEQHIEQMAA